MQLLILMYFFYTLLGPNNVRNTEKKVVQPMSDQKNLHQNSNFELIFETGPSRNCNNPLGLVRWKGETPKVALVY